MKTITLSIRVPEELAKQLKELATADSRTLNNYIAMKLTQIAKETEKSGKK